MAKKIAAIVSLSIIGVLIIATIVMANVKIDYSINCGKPNLIYVNNVQANDAEAQQIYDYIDNASKGNSLTALFNGTLNNKAEIKAENTSKTVPTTSTYRIEFVYNTPQNLMEGNKKFEDANGRTYTYQRLVFAVNQANGEAEYKVYVITDSAEPNTYTHYYTLQADFTELYSFLTSNF